MIALTFFAETLSVRRIPTIASTLSIPIRLSPNARLQSKANRPLTGKHCSPSIANEPVRTCLPSTGAMAPTLSLLQRIVHTATLLPRTSTLTTAKNTPNSFVKSACPSLSLRLTADQAIIPYFGVHTVAPPCIAGKTLLSSQSTSAQTTVAPLSSQPVSNSMPKNASFKLKNPASSNSVTSTASTTTTLNPLSPLHPRPTTSAVLTASKTLPTPLALSSRSVFLMA